MSHDHYGHAASRLLTAFLSVTTDRIIPLTAAGVSSGSKVFGAAILRKSDLSIVIVATNDEKSSPLLHGEINTIFQYHALPASSQPDPKDCLFFSTHEPCSLCLSGITWSGFDNFHYMFTYKDTQETFSIPHDLKILKEVFQTNQKTENDQYGNEILYNKSNAFWTANSLQELINEVQDDQEKEKLERQLQEVKDTYNGLSETYQDTKRTGKAQIPLA